MSGLLKPSSVYKKVSWYSIRLQLLNKNIQLRLPSCGSDHERQTERFTQAFIVMLFVPGVDYVEWVTVNKYG